MGIRSDKKVALGFTRIQLIVAIAITTILAGMLLPAFSKSKAKTKQVQFLNSLKHVGLPVLSYGEKIHDRVQFASLLDTKFTWGELIYTNHHGAAAVLIYTNWFCTFGVWSDPPDSVTSSPFKQIFVVSAIQNPLNYTHLADYSNCRRMGWGGLQFHTFRTNAQFEVPTRHNDAADVCCFYGRVESITKPRLEQVGSKALFGPERIPSYYS